ncbi:P-loop ATPase [Candidatus Woesearchaeota archaeon CG11_big_fil_rev_8_21_14_0_20_43_8]|nr:MAG: P-loop ATPase [Candidatus Woesearchaeota archaeon CG11_big_fil_rev_8_21_14_0_20_43_8]PIO07567.1 MAG: P-loop ATPase [Candidatus Woesearchaeota archaeon CG08_land_8_20_14_0_20_43_7]
MMKIAITGGKGGTGKSMIATALAYKLSKHLRVLLVDLDTECPNDHLILGIEQRKIDDVHQMVPIFDNEKCTRSGKCKDACTSHAIVQIQGGYPKFFEKLCNGCGACTIACKNISKGKKKIGEIHKGMMGGLTVISGYMDIGHAESAMIVTATKKHAHKSEDNYDLIIFDTAAGTHCNVVRSLMNTDTAFAVTEPTPLGEHDLDLILKVTSGLGIKTEIIINRSTIAGTENIIRLSKRSGSKVVAQVPYSESICKAYCNGKPVQDKSIDLLAEKIKRMLR